jgi:antitoxin component of RelBE/YafQ-DinJ toxin-antitoxin module
MKQIGVKMDEKCFSIVSLAIAEELGENISQIVRMALREFAKNHRIEVKKND